MASPKSVSKSAKAKKAKAKTASKTATKKSSSAKKAPEKKAPPKKAPEKKAPPKKTASKKTSPKTAVKAPAKSAVAAKKPAPKEVVKKAAKPVPKPVLPPPVSKPPVAGPPLRSGAAKPQGKILPRAFLADLAKAIKDAVQPVAQSVKGREIVSTATSGDTTFEIDKVAEKALLTYLKNARAPVAYYSEDAGYSTFSNAQPANLLIVDPIDGTRAAKSGFEGCVVAIASTRVIERPTMADVDNACVLEILGNRMFYAERGKGIRIYEGEQIKRPRLSQNTNLEMVAWSMTVPARPAELIFPTAARLIDLSSLKGGFFACNSTSFSLTRLLTGQLDACVDVAGRYLRDIPELVKDQFINAGRGVMLGIAPYDMAGALLIAQEAGCIVTDAYGKNFDDVLLLDSSSGNHQSLIAASNPELHQKFLSFFDTRIKQFEAVLLRHHAAHATK